MCSRHYLGVLALVFYAGHASRHLLHGHPEHLLWTCHLASVLIGVGLLAGSPMLNAVGVLWLLVGVPLWLLDLAAGSVFFPTSLLTHVGGLAIGLWGVTRLGMPPGAWWRAVAGFAALQLLCRLVTPDAANVNGAFRPWVGVVDAPTAEALLLAAGLLGTYVIERLVRGRLGARRAARGVS